MQMRKAKAVYSQLVTARDLATIVSILAGTQSQVKEWGSFIVEKRKALGMCIG